MKSKHRGIYKLSDKARKSPWVWERRVNGKRMRTFFSSLEEATLCKRAAEAESRRTGADLRLMFDGDAQKEYFAAKNILGEVSLVDAAMFYRDHRALYELKPSPVEEVVEAVIASRGGGVTKLHASQQESCFRRFAGRFAGRQLSSISQSEVFAWLSELGLAPSSMKEMLSKIAFLFRRATRLGYLKSFDGFDKTFLPKSIRSPIEVYSTEEVREILRYARKTCPVWLPNLALRSFVGLRTAEASRMHWEWISFERKRILIPAEICKTRDDWVLQSPNLPETVFRWLALVPESRRVGAIPAPPRTLSAVVPAANKRNGFRHTFCTMHISLYGSADKTATLLKHKGSSMLYSHYLGKLVPEEEAREYFSLAPDLDQSSSPAM